MVGTLLALAVVAILLLISRTETLVGFAEVAVIFAGMLSLGAITAFTRYVDGDQIAPLINITFNEARARRDLQEAIDIPANEIPIPEDDAPWELSAEALFIDDRALALAKLRIDLERELRRIAFVNELRVDYDRLGIGRLVDLLAGRDLLPAGIKGAFDNILPACNQAVHGADVESDVARSVLAVGSDLLSYLRTREAVDGRITKR